MKTKSINQSLAMIVGTILLFMLLIGLNPAIVDAAAWAPNTAYSVGAQVTYNGVTYQCIQAHTSLVGWEPPNVPALWQVVQGGTTPTSAPTATPTPGNGQDITDLGGAISAQYTDSPSGEDIAKVIDNNVNTKYLTFHSSGWIQYNATASYIVTQYSITSANDAPERDPKNWTFQGSNNGSTWVTLDSRSNETFPARFQKKSYSFSNNTGYAYYRLNLTASSGTTLQLAEWEIFGTFHSSVTPTPRPTATPTSTPTPTPGGQDITNLGGTISAQYTDSPSGEDIAKVIDNNVNTKYLTFHNSGWIQYNATASYIVTQYSITSANDAPERDPKNWTFQGSNNGSAWVTLDSRSNETFPARFQKKSYSFSNNTGYVYYRLNLTASSGTTLQLAEWEIFGTFHSSVTPTPLPTPPLTWQEHWFEHNQLLTRVFYDNDVAIYFDNDTPRSITWMNQLCGDVWRYVKQTYGDMNGGGNDPRLFAIFHTNKYGGGHPAYYFDSSHDYRNVIDIGAGPWDSSTGWNLNATVHEIGHIVESATNSTQGSPCFSLWQDSKWCEIFNYDVYVGLGKTSEANRWYNEMINSTDSFPRAGTQWFKNWFYPIWSQYGRSAVLSNFFRLMSQHFPKNGRTYARNMNWGEFVHFWSGAAGTNLKPLATNAFGWPSEWETQWQQARINFPFTYSNY